MAFAAKSFKSIFGKQLGIGRKGEMVCGGKVFGGVYGDCLITVGTKTANARALTFQFIDFNGDNAPFTEEVEIGVYLDATPSAFAATGGSTGIAAGANGTILQIVAKKLFKALPDTTGKLTLTYTDTGTEAIAFGVRLPAGRLVMSAAFPTG